MIAVCLWTFGTLGVGILLLMGLICARNPFQLFPDRPIIVNLATLVVWLPLMLVMLPVCIVVGLSVPRTIVNSRASRRDKE